MTQEKRSRGYSGEYVVDEFLVDELILDEFLVDEFLVDGVQVLDIDFTLV